MAVRAEAGQKSGALAAQDPSRVRNVVLVGPSGAGKTTLVEALLAHTGVITRAGTVLDGNTVSDHDPAAVRQQRSVALAVAPLQHDDVKINLIDTPGYADFVGEVRAGLRAADAALFVISAADSIDAATVAQWEECAAVDIPRAIVVARIDHQRADVDAAIEGAQDAFGSGVLPIYLPIRSGEEITGLYGLLSQTPEGQAPDDADDARSALIEAIIEQSEDEALMDRYLSGEDVELKTLITDLEKAVCKGSFHPVVPVCSTSGIGLDALLELAVGGFPSPLERELPSLANTADGSLTADPNGPLAAEVVRTSADAYVGRVSLVRVFSGTLLPEKTVHISGGYSGGNGADGTEGHETDERLTHVYSPLGATLREVPQCVAGDICALTKLGSAETGDTVSATDKPLLMQPWEQPDPLLPVAVVARTRGDEDALVRTLAKIVAADPTLRMERNSETHQTVLWCMGEAHADVVLSRLRAGGAEVDTEPVRVAMRETLAKAGRVTGRHVKQSGGHGQFAVCPGRVRAAAPRLRVRVRVQGGRWHGADAVHPERGEGHPGPAGARAQRGRPPGGGHPGHVVRREGPLGGLLRRGVPDRRLARAARGGERVRHGAAGADRRGDDQDPGRAPGISAWRPVRTAWPGAGHRHRRCGTHPGPRRGTGHRAAALRGGPARDDLRDGHLHQELRPLRGGAGSRPGERRVVRERSSAPRECAVRTALLHEGAVRRVGATSRGRRSAAPPVAPRG